MRVETSLSLSQRSSKTLAARSPAPLAHVHLNDPFSLRVRIAVGGHVGVDAENLVVGPGALSVQRVKLLNEREREGSDERLNFERNDTRAYLDEHSSLIRVEGSKRNPPIQAG